MENLEMLVALAGIQSYSAIAVAIILGLAAVGTGIGFALLGGKYLESSARNPEMMNPLQGKFFIIAGLLDAVAMIAVVIALIMVFANPFLGPISA